MNKFMKLAIEEAKLGIDKNHGGPFGAVVVKNGVVIGKGHNSVVKDNDPSEHGEIMAIREACKTINSFDLSGCEIYTTGEPCHMCLCACLWANIDKIYYGCTIKENEVIGFRDDKFDKIFGGRNKLKEMLNQIEHDECYKLFDYYMKLNGTKY